MLRCHISHVNNAIVGEKLVGDTLSGYTSTLDRPDTQRTRRSILGWESTLYYFCCFMPHWLHTAIVGQCLLIIIKKDSFLKYASHRKQWRENPFVCHFKQRTVRDKCGFQTHLNLKRTLPYQTNIQQNAITNAESVTSLVVKKEARTLCGVYAYVICLLLVVLASGLSFNHSIHSNRL